MLNIFQRSGLGDGRDWGGISLRTLVYELEWVLGIRFFLNLYIVVRVKCDEFMMIDYYFVYYYCEP